MNTDARQALAELVALNGLKERIEAANAGRGHEAAVHSELLDEYKNRQPLAWAAARAALTEQSAPVIKDSSTTGAGMAGMSISEALEFADEWTRGLTIYPGLQGWRVVCMVLAQEVRSLREKHDIALTLCAMYADRPEIAAEPKPDPSSHWPFPSDGLINGQ